MYVSEEKINKAIKAFRKHGAIFRTSEGLDAGISRRILYHMEKEGLLTELERGLYKLGDEGTLSNPSLTIVAKKIRKARICLISALDVHELTTAIPNHVYIALPRTSRNPKLNHPPLHVYRFSGQSLTEGIETHKVDGIEVQVYNPAKTIADCFKFRNKIGLDIAIEALKNGIRENKASFNEIYRFAKICRVQKVIRPYAETIAHS